MFDQLKTRLKQQRHLHYFYMKAAIYTITAILLAIAIPLTIHFSHLEDQEVEEESN